MQKNKIKKNQISALLGDLVTKGSVGKHISGSKGTAKIVNDLPVFFKLE